MLSARIAETIIIHFFINIEVLSVLTCYKAGIFRGQLQLETKLSGLSGHPKKTPITASSYVFNQTNLLLSFIIVHQ